MHGIAGTGSTPRVPRRGAMSSLYSFVSFPHGIFAGSPLRVLSLSVCGPSVFHSRIHYALLGVSPSLHTSTLICPDRNVFCILHFRPSMNS